MIKAGDVVIYKGQLVTIEVIDYVNGDISIVYYDFLTHKHLREVAERSELLPVKEHELATIELMLKNFNHSRANNKIPQYNGHRASTETYPPIYCEVNALCNEIEGLHFKLHNVQATESDMIEFNENQKEITELLEVFRGAIGCGNKLIDRIQALVLKTGNITKRIN